MIPHLNPYIPAPSPVWRLDAVADEALDAIAWLLVLVVALAGWSVTP